MIIHLHIENTFSCHTTCISTVIAYDSRLEREYARHMVSITHSLRIAC